MKKAQEETEGVMCPSVKEFSILFFKSDVLTLVFPFCRFSKSETNDVDSVVGRAQVHLAVVNSYRQHDIASFMVFPSDFESACTLHSSPLGINVNDCLLYPCD